MAYATFTATVEMKVSLNIDGISPASWEEIQNCVFSVVEKENLLKREAYKGEIVLPPMDSDKIRKGIGKAPEVSAAPEKPEDKYAKVLHYTNYADVIALFKDEAARPWAYEMTWLPAKVWMAKCPTLNNASLHGVSHTLGSMCANGLVQREERYNSGIKQNEILFRVPVPKTDEEEGHVNPRDVAIGNTIRALREQHGFSPKELSDLCGYDAGTIVQWELGLYTVSSAAMEKLKDLFGKDAFQGVA